MKTFEEVAKALTTSAVGRLLETQECEFCYWGLYSQSHDMPCPFAGYSVKDLDALAEWAGAMPRDEIWEVTTLDGTRRRCVLSPGTTLADIMRIQGQPVVELRRLDPPSPRMQPIPTTENDDEQIEDF